MTSMSICLGQTQQLTLLQELKQSCRVEIRQTLTLKLLLKRFNIWKALYKKAIECGKIRRYRKYGLDFEYALVCAKDIPDDIKTRYGWAFSVCTLKGFDALFAGNREARVRGEWLLFVVEDMYPGLPDGFLEYGAVHERGEQVTLGDHNLASKLEFAIANKEGNLEEYVAWFEANTPAKFADVFNYQTHLEYPDDEEFVRLLKSFCTTEEAKQTVRMIKGFRWPSFLLEKLTEYQFANEEISSLIDSAWCHVENIIDYRNLSIAQIVAGIRRQVAMRLNDIIRNNLSRYINPFMQERCWRQLRHRADEKFVAMLAARKQSDPDYFSDVIASGIQDSLPKDGVLSTLLNDALAAL